VGGEFCPSGLDVNIEFDPTKKMRGPENSPLGYARFFARNSRFPAISADLLGKQPSRMQWQRPGASGPILLATRPAKRGTTWQKPVAKGRHLVIPYPRWQKNDF
jgi:hypothetical protein